MNLLNKIGTIETSSSSEPLGQVHPNLMGTKHPWVEGFKVVQMKGNAVYQGETAVQVKIYPQSYCL